MAYNNILKARKSLIFAKNCDWCNKQITLNGEDGDPFVVNMEYKYFCINRLIYREPMGQVKYPIGFFIMESDHKEVS